MRLGKPGPKLIFIVTEDWYFCSHRLPIARAARDAGFEIIVVTRVERHGEQIRSDGFRLISHDFHRGALRPFRSIQTVVRLRKIFRTERPNLIHNVAMKPVILGAVASIGLTDVGIVNALAGLGYVFISKSPRARLIRPLVKLAFRSLFRKPNVRVVVQNPVDRAMLVDIGVSARNIVSIAGSGVDPERFFPSDELPGPITVAMVSRMLWDKGVGELVEAARRLRDSHPGLRVRLVGPPDPDNPSSIDESTLRSWAHEKVIDWSGPVLDAASVWAEAQIAVLPSYREGLPLSLLEAAACGRAMVATDVPGCREVVVHEETGLLVPPRDPNALAGAIARLADDRELRIRLGQAARKRVLERFTVERVVGETMSVYRELCPSA